ncbi:BTB/POZ protein [Rhizophagus irregularis DAOM 181602=DAOM 197198]|nr:BTB/POZ protein [Rhizophagus irregularis DAOM 181602=DAOM 197198]
MSKQFFSKLSQNYIEVLEDNEYYDITIEVEIFQIILKYIYGGIITLNEKEPLEILRVLVAADQLYLQEIVDYLQEYLINNDYEWMEQHFGLETEEIIGGYNPLKWDTSDEDKWGETKDSFIFSFKNEDNFKESILSRVIDASHALFYHNRFGPTFGDDDIDIFVCEDDKEYDHCSCTQLSYEKRIRDTDDNFSIEDYEVFQIITKND